MFKRIMALASGLLLSIGTAKADEQMRILAQNGNWLAMQHSPSMTASPDVCMLGNVTSHLFFRQDGDGLEVRVSDDSWSLPADVKGTIGLAIGALSRTFTIDSNTSNYVSASVSSDDAQSIFAAMDKATQMTVAIGKAKARTASLAGSARVTNAFKTCAGIKAPGQPTSSSNPFE